MRSNCSQQYHYQSQRSLYNHHHSNQHDPTTTTTTTTMKSFNNILSLAAGASALALPAEIEKRADQRFDSNVRSIPPQSLSICQSTNISNPVR
jgi:hypothetical protein